MNSAANGTPAFAVHDAIALDGDKLKPREALAVRTANTHANGHGVATEATHTLDGANGQGVAYKAKRTWWNGAEVATTTTTTGHNQLMPDKDRFDAVVECRDVAETIDSNYYKGQGSRQGIERPVAVQCYENHAQDSRVQDPIDTAPTQGSSNANSAGVSGNNPLVCFSKVSHPTAPNGEGERWDEREVAQTRNTFDNGEKRCQEVVVSMAQNTCDEVRIVGGDGKIAGALPAEPGMKQQTYVVSTNANGLITKGSGEAILSDEHHMALQCGGGQCGQGTPACVISTNSNGGDVAPTISSCEYKMGQKQKDTSGGYVVTRQEGATNE